MIRTCVICGDTNTNAIWPIVSDRRKGLPGEWHFAECSHCGVIAMMSLPTDEQLATYYSAYSRSAEIDLSKKASSRYPRLRRLFHRLRGDVDPRDFVQARMGTRVLDYGCGHAGYLRDFHDRGVSISGAEIAGYVVDACQKYGLDVRKINDFSHIPFADNEFDVVYLMQVFEHLREPHAFMDELARIMKLGGELYLAVPNVSSIWRRVFGNNWVSGWFAPFHLFHYNRDALTKLADQHGFDVEDSWSSTPVTWFSLNLKACLYPKENSLDWRKSWLESRFMSYLTMLMLRIIELPLRERDCLVMRLKKRI